MSGIRIDIDPAQFEAAKARLAHIKNGAARALSRALNKTASKAKTVASTKIREQIKLSASVVREKLTIRKATVSALSAGLRAEKRGLLLYHFVTNLGNAQTGRPRTKIRVQVKPGNTVVLGGAFYVRTLNSNLLTPAIRTSAARYPIKVLHGPSVSQVFTTVKDDIAPQMNEVLAANFQHETDWLYTQHPPPPGDGSDET